MSASMHCLIGEPPVPVGVWVDYTAPGGGCQTAASGRRIHWRRLPGDGHMCRQSGDVSDGGGTLHHLGRRAVMGRYNGNGIRKAVPRFLIAPDLSDLLLGCGQVEILRSTKKRRSKLAPALAPRTGFEPAAYRLGVRRSIS